MQRSRQMNSRGNFVCGLYNSRESFYCSLDEGHDGDHIAFAYNNITSDSREKLDQWVNELDSVRYGEDPFP